MGKIKDELMVLEGKTGRDRPTQARTVFPELTRPTGISERRQKTIQY
jgi:hypothetical protein